MPQAVFTVHLGAEKVLLFYQARKNRVHVTAEDGRTLSVPWALLRPFVTDRGIEGRFQIEFDAQGKAQALTRLG